MAKTEHEDEGSSSFGKRFELITAITLAILAAILAITDLGGGKYGDDEIMGTNEKANIYDWYQSKSVKQSLLEGQKDLLKTLLDSGSIRQEQIGSLESLMTRLDQDINRYKKEKKELLLGSAAVGKENWVQDIDGEFGKVVGAKEWESKLALLGRAGDKFDLAVLFLQLCLVVGAVSLVLQEAKLKWVFFGGMVLLGLVGAALSLQAFFLVMPIG
ncbi:MAG: DUF4337 domain-containing protein [Syntrophobacteraceae bacterium]